MHWRSKQLFNVSNVPDERFLILNHNNLRAKSTFVFCHMGRQNNFEWKWVQSPNVFVLLSFFNYYFNSRLQMIMWSLKDNLCFQATTLWKNMRMCLLIAVMCSIWSCCIGNYCYIKQSHSYLNCPRDSLVEGRLFRLMLTEIMRQTLLQ